VAKTSTRIAVATGHLPVGPGPACLAGIVALVVACGAICAAAYAGPPPAPILLGVEWVGDDATPSKPPAGVSAPGPVDGAAPNTEKPPVHVAEKGTARVVPLNDSGGTHIEPGTIIQPGVR
jgi:hypothetical protein